jgi:hypothetical protein
MHSNGTYLCRQVGRLGKAWEIYALILIHSHVLTTGRNFIYLSVSDLLNDSVSSTQIVARSSK